MVLNLYHIDEQVLSLFHVDLYDNKTRPCKLILGFGSLDIVYIELSFKSLLYDPMPI